MDENAIDYCVRFSCGKEYLDDFFSHHADAFGKELTGKTHCRLMNYEPSSIISIY